MSGQGYRRTFYVIACLLVVSNYALGDWSPGPGAILVDIQATSGGVTGGQSWLFPAGLGSLEQYSASLPQTTIYGPSGGLALGTINSFGLTYIADPSVSILFVATAGGFDTTFTITSAVVSFPALTDPIGLASAEVTLTDTGQNGATLTPVAPSIGVFTALYNFGSTFVELVGAQSLAGGGMLTASESFGPSQIAGPVTSIQGYFHFTLSANDGAAGNGTFSVARGTTIPAPGAILLGTIGAGLVTWLRRRRTL
jgi:hypothetical protein